MASSRTKRTRTNPPETGNETLRWIKPGTRVTVAGRVINGMVYVGPIPFNGFPDISERFVIDPALPVAQRSRGQANENWSYWASYREFDRQGRASYLDWLASGRADAHVGVINILLFFYGLESRFFLDNPSARERKLLVAEAERLLNVYGHDGFIHYCLDQFLKIARIIVNPDERALPSCDDWGTGLTVGQRVAMGTQIKRRQSLDSDWMLCWFLAVRGHTAGVSWRRALPECKAYFHLLFKERYPRGFQVLGPMPSIQGIYESASAEFFVDYAQTFPNVPEVSSLSKPLEVARMLASEVSGALSSYSRFLDRQPENRHSVAAHVLLPQELQPLVPCKALDQFRNWAKAILRKGGFVLVEDAIAQITGSKPDRLGKLDLAALTKACALISFGAVPDPTRSLRGPKFGAPLLLFRVPKGASAKGEVGPAYHQLLLAIAIGSFVARADGSTESKELKVLNYRIATANIKKIDRMYLKANLEWLAKVPPTLSTIGRRVANLTESSRQDLGRIAFAVAAADKIIDPDKIAAIEKIYKALGLATESLYSDLHAVSIGDEPITVRPAAVSSGSYSLPPSASRKNRRVLDQARIATLMSDSEEVASLLDGIFDEEEPTMPSARQVEENESAYEGLDPQHASFLEVLLTQEHWDESGLLAAAERFQLMSSGAIEIVNEWSHERFGDLLMEEYEGYDLNPNIVSQLLK